MNEISTIGNDIFGNVRQSARPSERQGGTDVPELRRETSDKLIRSQYSSMIDLVLNMDAAERVSSLGIDENFDSEGNVRAAAEAILARGV